MITFLHMLQTYLMSWCRAVHWRLCFQASLYVPPQSSHSYQCSYTVRVWCIQTRTLLWEIDADAGTKLVTLSPEVPFLTLLGLPKGRLLETLKPFPRHRSTWGHLKRLNMRRRLGSKLMYFSSEQQLFSIEITHLSIPSGIMVRKDFSQWGHFRLTPTPCSANRCSRRAVRSWHWPPHL